MGTRSKFFKTSADWTTGGGLSPEQAADQVAQAVRDVESSLQALGKALLAGAQSQVAEAVGALKLRMSSTELGLEALISQVPALGPLVAMELHRMTHPEAEEDSMATRPTNVDEASATETSLSGAYLDCIGCHMA